MGDLVARLEDYINNTDDCALRVEAAARIRELEAEVRALRSAGYSCPTCGNDAVDSVANVTDSGGSEP